MLKPVITLKVLGHYAYKFAFPQVILLNWKLQELIIEDDEALL